MCNKCDVLLSSFSYNSLKANVIKTNVHFIKEKDDYCIHLFFCNKMQFCSLFNIYASKSIHWIIHPKTHYVVAKHRSFFSWNYGQASNNFYEDVNF